MVKFRGWVTDAPDPTEHPKVVANHPNDGGVADITGFSMDVGCFVDDAQIKSDDGEFEEHEGEVPEDDADLEPVEKGEEVVS